MGADVLSAALRRFAAVVAAAVVAAALVGLLVVAVAKVDLRRGLAIGFYVCGAGSCGLAVLLGAAPPVRGKRDGGFVGFGRWVGGGIRWATRSEREAVNLPALLVTVGVVLIVVGVAVDDRSPH
jgi:hypothetical protein